MKRAPVPAASALLAELPRLRAEADALVSRAEFLLGAADELAKLIERAVWHARGLPGEPAAPVPAARFVTQALALEPPAPRLARRARKPKGAASDEASAAQASRRHTNSLCGRSENLDNP